MAQVIAPLRFLFPGLIHQGFSQRVMAFDIEVITSVQALQVTWSGQAGEFARSSAVAGATSIKPVTKRKPKPKPKPKPGKAKSTKRPKAKTRSVTKAASKRKLVTKAKARKPGVKTKAKKRALRARPSRKAVVKRKRK